MNIYFKSFLKFLAIGFVAWIIAFPLLSAALVYIYVSTPL